MILGEDWNTERVKLQKLFSEYSDWVQQIIRMRTAFYSWAVSALNTWRSLRLFNLTDPVNDELLRQYEQGSKSQWLLAEIHGDKWIIKKSSLRVVDVLEMKNVSTEEIMDRNLLQNSLAWVNSIMELTSWLSEKFYKGLHISPSTPFLYRKIKYHETQGSHSSTM